MKDDFDPLKAAIRKIVSPDDEELAAFTSVFSIKKIKKKEVLLAEGAICRYIWFINKGLIRDYFHRDGLEVTAGFFKEGEFITNYESFISQKPSKAYIDALEDSELLAIGYDSLQYLYSCSKTWERAGRLIAEQRFLISEQKKDGLLSNSPDLQYLSLVQEQPEIVQRVPQYYIASYLGVSPEHLSRIRKKIQGS
jgi:CRP-like cAMP-binding protein